MLLLWSGYSVKQVLLVSRNISKSGGAGVLRWGWLGGHHIEKLGKVEGFT
jgi:hypothetical protein